MNKLVCYLVLILFVSTPTHASDIIVGGWSYHKDRDKQYNEQHDTFGYSQDGWNVVWYNNSKNRNTVIVAKDYLYPVTDWWSVGVMAGLATGYDYYGGVKGAALGKMSFQYKRFGADFNFLPDVVYHINFKYNTDFYLDTSSYNDLKDDLAFGYSLGYKTNTAHLTYKITDRIHSRLYHTRGGNKWVDFWNEPTWKDAWAWQKEYIFVNMTGLVADYYWTDNFATYAGVVYNNTKYKTTYYIGASPDGGVLNVSDNPINVNDGDLLKGLVKWSTLGYTVGLRYGNPFSGRKYNWFVDVGVASMSGINGEASYIKGGLLYQGYDDILNQWELKEEYKYSKYKVFPKIEVGYQWKF